MKLEGKRAEEFKSGSAAADKNFMTSQTRSLKEIRKDELMKYTSRWWSRSRFK